MINSEVLQKTLELKGLLQELFFHDVMNKLHVVKGYTELGLAIQDPSQLPAIKRVLDDIEKMVNNYNDFLQIGPEEKISIEDALNKACEMIEIEGIDWQIDLQKEEEIQVDPLFIAILYNLLQNSLIHSKPEQELLITIKIDKRKLIFADNGKGIKEKKKREIFEKPGDALTIIKEIGKKLQYDIKETSKSGQGARFEITFYPKAD